MNEHGRYGDDCTFALPSGWFAASEEVLDTAVAQTLAAMAEEHAVEGLVAYYDRGGSYAGTMFLDAQPNDPVSIEAADRMPWRL